MEQLQQLLDILKQTPEMALWGLIIWCLYILGKLASVVYAIKVIFQLAIKKWHDYKIKKIDLERENLGLKSKKVELETTQEAYKLEKKYDSIKKLAKKFDRATISDVEMEDFIRLLDVLKSTNYIHRSDIEEAIKKLQKQ